MSDTIRSEEREKAEFESRKCLICGGAGMVIVFHFGWIGSRFIAVTTERNGEIIETKEPGEVSAHCICKLGQWMRSKVSEAMRARIPDGIAIAEGRSNWCFQSPGSDPEERYEAPTRAAITARFGKTPGAF